MADRKIIIAGYDTAANGWTLASCNLSSAVAIESYAQVPGRSGRLDLSTVLTDGEPCYDNRTFTARLETSEGTRLERETRIDALMHTFHGRRWNIFLPDDTSHYITGRISITKEYNDNAHAAVTIKANCDPWRYSTQQKTIMVRALSTEQTVSLSNNGGMPVIPTVTVTEDSVTLSGEGWSRVLTKGTYTLPDLYMKQETIEVTYKGSGDITFAYREAVL